MSNIELTTTEAQNGLAIREKVRYTEIASTMGRMYQELAMYMQGKGIDIAGPPFAYYHSWTDQETDMECGFPVAGKVQGEGKISECTLPAVKAVVGMHVGPYNTVMQTYQAIEAWMKQNGHQPAKYMWESYLNDPSTTPPEQLMTRVVWPIE
jgi:effector-binding domain-containing protein